MRKNSKHVPPALRHGIYSAIGLLPTGDPVEFEKFKKKSSMTISRSVGQKRSSWRRSLACNGVSSI